MTREIAIQTAYSTASNTHGHSCHVVEQRPAEDKSPTAWVPMYNKGPSHFGVVETSSRHYPGETECIHLNCFLSGAEAAAYAMMLKNYYNNSTYRVKKYFLPQEQADTIEVNNTWKAREALRMTDGTYTPLPWAGEAWFMARHATLNHFAHVSTEDAGKVAFTRDDRQGQSNNKVRMSAGRYLQEFYQGELAYQPRKETGAVSVRTGEKVTIDALNWYARTFNKQYGGGDTLAFATTSEDMVRVYIAGPTSCMSYKANELASDPHHPAEVYAAGDLQVAYLSDSEGHITARALVWPAQMRAGRVYGDEMALAAALTELGYSTPSTTALVGARMLKIEHGDGYVMPYVDGFCNYGKHSDGIHWKIGGDRYAGHTNGLDHDPENDDRCECEHCGSGYDEGEGYTIHIDRNGSTEVWCEMCMQDHAFECEASGDMYRNRIPHVTLANGNYVANCNLEDYSQCTLSLEWQHSDEMAGEFEDSGEMVSADTVEDKDLVQDEDGTYWRPENLPAVIPQVSETQSEQAAA
jgi:hypothetical protein